MQLRINVRAAKAIVAILGVVLVVLAVLLIMRRWETGQTNETTDSQSEAEDLYADEETEGLLYLGGSWYALREDLETVLVMGVDEYDVEISEDQYINSAVADFLMLVVIDEETGTTQAIHLNRDTMTEITILGVTGAVAGTFTGQLALAHTYGSGGEDSCENTVDAVSNLLYGVEINHYISVTMNGVALLNDLAGGVTLEVLDDFTGIDSTLVQGETVTLQGEQALTYVRTRAGLDDSSNLARMERQRQYLAALQDQVIACASDDAEFILSALVQMSEYLVSDCTIEQLSEIGNTLLEQPVESYLTLDGEAVLGETYMEYYVDEDALQDLVLELFYEPVQVD